MKNRWMVLMGCAIAGLGLAACDGDEPCVGMACVDAAAPDVDSGNPPDVDSGGALLCTNTCASSNDMECDDGGPDSLFSVCALGTDCADCGPRDPGVICTPDCTGRSCGGDGCGGSCAPGCVSGQSCNASGQCIDDGCVQDCGSRVCGADPVCGASCGSCSGGQACSSAGQCQCQPQCSGRECGDDGCGGTCGAGCTAPETCDGAGQCGLEMRTWSGATANLRLIVGDLLTTAAGRKVCIYGTDDDRPYMVLNRLGFAAGETITVDATYASAPAGIPLRVSHGITVGLGADTPAGCDPSSATPLGSAALTEGGYYTVVARTYDDFFTRECAATPAEDYCEFYGRSDSGLPSVPCANEDAQLFEDGYRISGTYYGALRIVNFTSNASQIGSSFAGNSMSTHGNVAGGTRVGTGYDPPESADRLRICPRYLACDPRITGAAESDAIFGCTNGEAPWILAETTSSRFSADDRNTTVYVFGNAGRLNAGSDAITGDELGLVIAHDVTDGALP